MKSAVALSLSGMVLVGACAQQQEKQLGPRIHSLSNDEVLQSLPPSPGEVIEVRGDEHDEFYGYLMKLPVAGEWQAVPLDNLGCSVDLPDQPIQPWSMRVLQQDDMASLWLYPVFQGQFGILEAIEIRLQRFTPASLQEHIAKEGAFINDFLAPSPEATFREWEQVAAHPVLSFQDQVDWQTWYRKDVAYENGDTLRITGRLHKYTAHATGSSLFPKMDATTRRVIESVTPIESS